MAGRRLTWLIALCAVVAACAGRAGATTVVPMSDRDLALNARAVVEATVVDAEPVWNDADGVVYTYVTLDVERAHKGDVPPGLVVLRQLGGATPEHATVIFGAPDLTPGLRTLLFLNAAEDGALHVAHLGLGLFRIENDPVTGEELVVRTAYGAAPAATADTVTEIARRESFVATLTSTLAAPGATEASAAGATAPVAIVPPEYAALTRGDGARPAFTFLGGGYRWFEPDTRAKVRFDVNTTNGPTPSAGVDEVKSVLGVWSSVSGSRLRLDYGGSTRSAGIRADGVSAVSFGDPRGQIDDLVGCQGVLAMSGISGNPGERATVHGRSFARLTEADLAMNNGIECVLAQWPGLFQEILTHEMGHCLGLGHSSQNLSESDPSLRDATMYFVAHNDGRGAAIRSDDEAGIRFMYGTAAGPLALATDAVPDAVPSRPYSFALKADGGSSPYRWSLAGGSLPSGLVLSPDGTVSGTPAAAGTSSFSVRVTDATGAVQQRSLRLAVTSTPSPFVGSAEYLGAKRKLQLTGRYLDDAVLVTINGRRLDPSPVVRFKPAKGRLLISGSATALGLRGDGTDTVSVTIDGRASNVERF